MARIARQGLRLRGLPLFSLGQPWQSVCDAEGLLGLRLFEPRYVELARRVLPPAADGKFGYAESYPPKVGQAGVLAQIEQYRWTDDNERPTVLLSARAQRRFRILEVKSQDVSGGPKQPLYVASIQLLDDRDTKRGVGIESLDYWTGEFEGKRRADDIKHGTALIAHLGAPIFQSMESWSVVSQVPAGGAVVAAGPPKMVEGYLMVPLVPEGAVELPLFREPRAAGGIPSEKELRAALRDMEVDPSSPARQQQLRDFGRKSGRGGGKSRA